MNIQKHLMILRFFSFIRGTRQKILGRTFCLVSHISLLCFQNDAVKTRKCKYIFELKLFNYFNRI